MFILFARLAGFLVIRTKSCVIGGCNCRRSFHFIVSINDRLVKVQLLLIVSEIGSHNVLAANSQEAYVWDSVAKGQSFSSVITGLRTKYKFSANS